MVCSHSLVLRSLWIPEKARMWVCSSAVAVCPTRSQVVCPFMEGMTPCVLVGTRGQVELEEVFGLSGGRWDDSNGTTVWGKKKRPSQTYKPDGKLTATRQVERTLRGDENILELDNSNGCTTLLILWRMNHTSNIILLKLFGSPEPQKF